MTTTIQNLSDLQDRRIMMDKKLPPYGYAFVILTGLFMIFLVIWSTQTNRIYVSQSSRGIGPRKLQQPFRWNRC